MTKQRILYVLAALIFIPALACGGGNKNKSSGADQPTQAAGAGQPTTRPAAAATTAAGGAGNAELATLLANFAKVKSFRATITVETTGAPKQEGTMEVVLPDRYHFNLAGLGEFISIGSDSYLKIGTTWVKQPGAGVGAIFSANDLNAAVQGFANDSKVQKGSTDTVNGKRCQIYTYTDGTTSTQICVADGLPLRIVSKAGSSTTTMIFSDYNANIEIKAPI